MKTGTNHYFFSICLLRRAHKAQVIPPGEMIAKITEKAKHLESHLYFFAPSKEFFQDVSTLKSRLKFPEDNFLSLKKQKIVELQKDLRTHIQQCRDIQCDTPNCLYYKAIIFWKCKDTACEVCTPPLEERRVHNGEEYKDAIC